jgi:hypothetical protein
MASSPKKGGERTDSLTSAHAPTSSDPTETSEASGSLSSGRMAAFKKKVGATWDTPSDFKGRSEQSASNRITSLETRTEILSILEDL